MAIPEQIMEARRIHPCRVEPSELDTADIESEITTLAAHVNAATCRLLLLIAEFDRRLAWADWGCKSCAQWVSWRCGIAPNPAREHVRVARALENLPLVRGTFGAGRLSYSQVRALTRMATPATEADLVDIALNATASQLERLARAYRSVARVEELEETNRRHEDRSFHWNVTDDGSVVIFGRLSPEDGAVVVRALEAAVDEQPVPEGQDAVDPVFSHGRSGRFSRRASDAMVAVAEGYLAGDASRNGGDRYQVVVHVDEAALAADEGDVCELQEGIALHPETARRLSCDASVVRMTEGTNGILDVGRKTRSIPPSLRRALQRRDRTCRFPGCDQSRFVDAHHVKHWAHGGETNLSNLVQLCRYHHRLVHEEGFRVRAEAGGWVFLRPGGTPIQETHVHGVTDGRDLLSDQVSLGIDDATCVTGWAGDRLDVDGGIVGLLSTERPAAHPNP